MKTVFSNASQVIHLFAQQLQNTARSSNVFFEKDYNFAGNYGNKIYSYGHHYLLGEFITDHAIMINDIGYSNTTSKHIYLLMYATNQYEKFYITKTDINYVYNTVIDNKNKIGKARKPELYISPILSLHKSLIEYYTFISKLTVLRKDKKFKEIEKIIASFDDPNYKEKLKELAIKKAKQQARKEAKILKENFSKFLNYEINSLRVGNLAYLRLSKDGENIETSQNADVPIKEAKILFYRIMQNKPVKGFKIGYYTVISINGTLKVGCHEISKKEILRFAKSQNWNVNS